MNKSKIAGWDNVFTFSLKQTLKSKAYIIGTILMIAFGLGGILLTGGSGGIFSEEEFLTAEIEKLYVYDETGLLNENIKELLVGENKAYEKTKVEIIKEKTENIRETFSEYEDCDKAILLHLFVEDTYYVADSIKTSESIINDMNAGIFSEVLLNVISESIYEKVQITDEQLEFLQTEIDGKVSVIENDAVEEDGEQSNFMSTSSIAMVLFMIMVFILAVAGENASTSMVTEKATRVIEYILTSVRPLAIIVGKVLAIFVAQIIQLVLMAVSAVAGTFIVTKTGDENMSVSQLAESIGATAVVENISVPRVIIALLIMVGGILLYLTIASLIGSTVSKMEELTQANMAYSMVLLVGAYSSMILTMFNPGADSTLQNVLLIFPLSSPFVTPVFLVTGDCGLLTGVISLLVMILAIILVTIFVAKVFETVIMYNGSKVSFKMILEFAGIGKKSASKKGGADIE